MRRLLLVLLLISTGAHAAQRSFNVSAHQFTYDVSPAPMTVAVGDVVTLNLTAADDGIGEGHGFFLEHYAEELNVVRPGQSRTIQFTATIPGTFTFFCTRVCGEGHDTMSGTLTVRESTAAAPTVTAFVPTRGPMAGGTVVTITGTGFQTGASVLFGSVLGTGVSVVSAERILVISPPAQDVPGVAITVINPDQQSGTSQQLFSYDFVTAPFSVTSVSPSTGTTAGGTALTISGTGFVAGATVAIGGVPADNAVVLNAFTILTTTPLGPVDIDSPTPRSITVTNPDGRLARLDTGFSWILPPLEIEAITPEHGPSTGGTELLIVGAGITTAQPMTVLIGGKPAKSVAVLNAVTLIAVTPAGSGTADVVVRRGTESATRENAFQYDGAPKRRAVKR